MQVFFSINHLYVLKRVIVRGKGYKTKRQCMHSILREIFLCKCLRKLASTIGTKVKKYHYIVFFNSSNRLVVLRKNYRLNEFIRKSCVVTILDCLYWIAS